MSNEPMCPGCKEVPASRRQERRPNRCDWCGYDHDTGEVAGFVPASVIDDIDYMPTTKDEAS